MSLKEKLPVFLCVLMTFVLLGTMTLVQCQQTAEEWLYSGMALYNQGKYGEAVKACNEAIQLDPNLTDAWFIKGNALFSQHEQRLAANAFYKCVEFDPQNATAWNNLGKALYSPHESFSEQKKVIQAFDKSIELDPQNAAAWCNKGIVLRDNATNEIVRLCSYGSIDFPRYAGLYEEAITFFDKSLEIDPQYAPAWVEKGIALEKQGKPDEAMNAYEEAIRLDPKLASAWIAKGNYFLDHFKYAEAVKAFDNAIDIDSLDLYAWDGLDRALTQLCYYEEARHVETLLSSESPIRSDRTEAAFSDHENRTRLNLTLHHQLVKIPIIGYVEGEPSVLYYNGEEAVMMAYWGGDNGGQGIVSSKRLATDIIEQNKDYDADQLSRGLAEEQLKLIINPVLFKSTNNKLDAIRVSKMDEPLETGWYRLYIIPKLSSM